MNRLFLLGAGASHAVTKRPNSPASEAPLDTDFISRLQGLSVKRPHWVTAARDRIFAEWKDKHPFQECGLEEAILKQLGHLEFIDAMHKRKKKGSRTEFDWLSDLSHLICHVMSKTKESTAGTYRRFAGMVFPKGTKLEDLQDRVITFNYDDLLDTHVIERAGIERTYFDKLREDRESKAKRKLQWANPLIVKLHGSVNWRCERDEFRGIIEGTFQDAPHVIPTIWYDPDDIPRPDDDAFPLIVPPLPSKPLSSMKLFQYLWTRAYEYLHECRELVICGYSLPPADRLAWSLFGNFSNSNLEEITIVDPKPEIIGKWQALLRRRGVASARWTYYDDFSDYVQRM